jgi:hypothetical protein
MKRVKPVSFSFGVPFTSGHLIVAFTFVVCILMLTNGGMITEQLIIRGVPIALPLLKNRSRRLRSGSYINFKL